MILTLDFCFVSSYPLIFGIAAVCLVLATVLALAVFWLKRMKRMQRRLRKVELELAGEEVHFDRASASEFTFGPVGSMEEEEV